VRRGNDRVRIAAQLIDGTSGVHVWAKTYDGLSGDLWVVQDEVTKQLVGALGVNIRESELQRSLRKPPGNVNAYDFVLRASRLWAEGSAAEHLRQRELLENAVALDPRYARAQAMLAFAYLDEHRWNYNRVPARPDPLRSALEKAELAVRVEPADAFVHYALAKILFFAKQLDRFEVEVQKTLELNPNFADAMADLGLRFAHLGRLDEGVSLTRRAMRLNPLHPGWYHFTFVVESYIRRDYERTLAETHKINWPDSFWTYYSLAAANAQLGRMREAHTAARQLLKLYSGDFGKDSERLLDEQNVPPATKAHWQEGLRKAGAFELKVGE
jgi:adenylate cyclase